MGDQHDTRLVGILQGVVDHGEGFGPGFPRPVPFLPRGALDQVDQQGVTSILNQRQRPVEEVGQVGAVALRWLSPTDVVPWPPGSCR